MVLSDGRDADSVSRPGVSFFFCYLLNATVRQFIGVLLVILFAGAGVGAALNLGTVEISTHVRIMTSYALLGTLVIGPPSSGAEADARRAWWLDCAGCDQLWHCTLLPLRGTCRDRRFCPWEPIGFGTPLER